MNKISIVVPFLNEEKNIPVLFKELIAVSNELSDNYEFEFVFVDDGSTDATWSVMKELLVEGITLICVRHHSRCGQTQALKTGLDRSTGDICVTMDGDLQHNPKEMKRLLMFYHEGFDLVIGCRENRNDQFWLRRLPSWIANKLVRMLFGIRVKDVGTGYRVIKGDLARSLDLRSDLHRFIPVLIHYRGAKYREIPITCRERYRGKSNYNLMRTFSVIIDLLLLFFKLKSSFRPLEFFGRLGLLSFLLGFILGVLLLFQYLKIQQVGYGDVVLVAIFLVIGVQSILAGLFMENQLNVKNQNSVVQEEILK